MDSYTFTRDGFIINHSKGATPKYRVGVEWIKRTIDHRKMKNISDEPTKFLRNAGPEFDTIIRTFIEERVNVSVS